MIAYPSIRPEILRIGPLSLRWYAMMYIVGYVVGFTLLRRRVRQGLIHITEAACESYLSYLMFGMLIGARLIYCIVYNWDYYSLNPLETLAIWHGGLSFHGAVLGMVIASAVFARQQHIGFFEITDSLAFCSAPGLFFGRMGNFINAELYGRPTNVPWAMVFPTDPDHLPRHPSQLYQGLTEGLLLFVCLWALQTWMLRTGRFRYGVIGTSYLIGYGIFRFLTEFTREPDRQLGFVLGPFSMGQILCAIMIVTGILIQIVWVRRQPVVHPEPPAAQV